MSDRENLDYIIVGQGISGSCLAYELLRRGLKIAVLDDSWRGAACLVSAGVINPITGKRLVKSWRSELAHECAKKFYRERELEFEKKFFYERKILQLCKSEEESELWLQRKNQEDYASFVGEHFAADTHALLNDNFGSYFIERSAWVESASAMSAFKNYFISRGVCSRSALIILS